MSGRWRILEDTGSEENGNEEEEEHDDDDSDDQQEAFSPWPRAPLWMTPKKSGGEEDGEEDSDEEQERQSTLIQSSLLALLCMLVGSIMFISYLALLLQDARSSSSYSQEIVLYSTTHRAGQQLDTNMLGLYWIPTARPTVKTDKDEPQRWLPSEAPSSSSAPAYSGEQQDVVVDDEAYFLRYFIMPLEEVPGSNHTGKTTRLLRPRSQLVHTTKMISQELADVTKEDIVEPIKERWSSRFHAIKRVFSKTPSRNQEQYAFQYAQESYYNMMRDKEERLLETYSSSWSREGMDAIDESKSLPGSQGSYPHNMLGAFPSPPTDGKHGNSQTPNFGLGYHLRKSMKLPKLMKRQGRTVCPTNLFCYYTLPPTITLSRHNPTCETYCGRCFETSKELKQAIQDYLEDPSSASFVAKTYGWPINNWCVSQIQDFSFAFANASDFNEPLHHWDMTSATTLQGMFINATRFNQPLQQWDIAHVTSLQATFANAHSFQQSLAAWNTARVEDASQVFENAFKFDQDLSSWNVAQVTDMSYALAGAKKFRGPLWQSPPNSTANVAGLLEGTKLEKKEARQSANVFVQSE